MIKNIWINIPGFSKYEINRESRQIRSYCRGVEPRILKPCNNALILKADNGEKYTGSLKRFLYSAEKNIDPRFISLCDFVFNYSFSFPSSHCRCLFPYGFGQSTLCPTTTDCGP